MIERHLRWLRGFPAMWFGELVSLIGSGLTRFALGIWIFQRTGSVTQFSIIAVLASLPAVLASPLAGVLVDRWDRRKVLIWCNVCSGLAVPFAIAMLVRFGTLQLWEIYVIEVVSSVVTAFQWPAYIAATSAMVPKHQLGRVNGMGQVAGAASEIVAPIFASLLLGVIGLLGIVSLDLASFAFAAVTLLLVRIPGPTALAEVGEEPAAAQGKRPLLDGAGDGWRFVRGRPGLVRLLTYFALINLVFSAASVLVTPLVLSFADAKALALVQAMGSAGLLGGGLLMSVTGGPRPRIHGVLGLGLLFSVAMAAGGLHANVQLIAVSLCLFMAGLAIISGSGQAIWQVKVPLDLQGRVFAARRMIAMSTTPIGFLASGWLADRVFEPTMMPGGAFASTAGRLIGVGRGRGIALLILTLAAIPLLASIWGYMQPRLRRVEDEIPDALEPAAAR
jgi:MFS family permease